MNGLSFVNKFLNIWPKPDSTKTIQLKIENLKLYEIVNTKLKDFLFKEDKNIPAEK